MGLDSYVFRICKPKELEDRIYTMEEIVDLKLEGFRKEETEDTLVADLKPYCREVMLRVPCIDLDKICREHDLSHDTYICMRDADGCVGVMDPENDMCKMFTREEIQSEYALVRTEAYCVFECERVAYWRKNYDVQNFFYGHVDNVANTGYYRLDLDVIEDFNAWDNGIRGRLPMEAPTEDVALFYHEWY